MPRPRLKGAGVVDMAPHIVEAEMLFLQDIEVYKVEKPFQVLFDVSGFGKDAIQTNLRVHSRPVQIRDARGEEARFRLAEHGFEFRSFVTSMRDSDFDDNTKIEGIYFNEVKQFLSGLLGESLVHVSLLNYQRRKRSSEFPYVDASTPSFQPIPRAHCDYCPGGLGPSYGQDLQVEVDLTGLPYRIINIWRVTRGPNSDWPLAVCDYNSLDIANDLEECDDVGRNGAKGALEIYHRAGHRWYYLGRQQVDEVIVISNTDSRGYHIPFAPHAAFDNEPENKDKILRESLEISTVCFLRE